VAAWNALLHFIELSHSDNEYFVVAVSSRPALLIDWTRTSKTAAEQLNRYKLTSERHGNTALYDACYFSLEKMRGGAHSKQAILLFSDGQDNNSKYTFKDVREQLKETGVLLYSIGITGSNDPGSSLGMAGQSALDELSAASGGKAFFPNTIEDINVLFDRLAVELRHQYLLGFKPSQDKADGKWHKIKIKVTPPSAANGRAPDVSVRHREGYYATKNPR
jgi:Ca-activated chloride channel family protein